MTRFNTAQGTFFYQKYCRCKR